MNDKIKKMIKVMEAKEKKCAFGKKRRRLSAGEAWSLYILQCGDGSFYTGITNDVEHRFKMHSKGKGARYTRTRQPLKLLYQEKCGIRTQALVRECAVKALPRKRKQSLIISLA